jgi:hypothetical protein
MIRTLFRVWIPLALAIGYALWSFAPQREGLATVPGEDGAFNAWTLLHLFRTLDAHGPGALH